MVPVAESAEAPSVALNPTAVRPSQQGHDSELLRVEREHEQRPDRDRDHGLGDPQRADPARAYLPSSLPT